MSLEIKYIHGHAANNKVEKLNLKERVNKVENLYLKERVAWRKRIKHVK